MSDIHSTGLLQIGTPRVWDGHGEPAVSMPCAKRGSVRLLRRIATAGGADFFDFIPYQPRGLVVAIGEVSGPSGAQRPLLLPGLRGFLRTSLPGDTGDIRRVVRDLNRALCDTSPDSFYATLFCAAIDPDLRQLHYVNAGHEPALLIRGGTERVYRLESTGTVLGLTTRSGYGVRNPGNRTGRLAGGVQRRVAGCGQLGGTGLRGIRRASDAARLSWRAVERNWWRT